MSRIPILSHSLWEMNFPSHPEHGELTWKTMGMRSKKYPLDTWPRFKLDWISGKPMGANQVEPFWTIIFSGKLSLKNKIHRKSLTILGFLCLFKSAFNENSLITIFTMKIFSPQFRFNWNVQQTSTKYEFLFCVFSNQHLMKIH